MAEPVESYEIHCGSCGQTFGWSVSPNALRRTVYCSEWCLREPPVERQPEKNDILRIMVWALGMTAVEVANEVGMPHSSVYRVINRD